MNGEFVEARLESGYQVLKQQIDAQLETALPRLLHYLWQPLLPFLMTPTPSVGLIAAVPEKRYCQEEILQPQQINLVPTMDEVETITDFPTCYCQIPALQKLYPIQLLSQKKTYGIAQTQLTMVLKNTQSRGELLLDHPICFAVTGDYSAAVSCWQWYQSPLKFCLQYNNTTVFGRVSPHFLSHHAYDTLLLPILQYALAPETVLLLKIELDQAISISPDAVFECIWCWDAYLEDSIFPIDAVTLVPNAMWVCNAYETDAVPIRKPSTRDVHWIESLQSEISTQDILAVASVVANTDQGYESIPAGLSACATSPFSSRCYYYFHELQRVGLQLGGDFSASDWLSVSILAMQGDKPFLKLLKGKVNADLSGNAVGWGWKVLHRFSPPVRQRKLPVHYTDVSWLTAPLQLFQSSQRLREYLGLFLIKAPNLANRLAAIEEIYFEHKQIFRQGALRFIIVIRWQMNKMAFSNEADCQLFLQTIYVELSRRVPYGYQLQFELIR